MNARTRTAFVLATAALLVGTAWPCRAAAVPARVKVREPWPRDAAQHETAFVTDINRLRASHGLPVLKVHAHLTRKARDWAATMAAAHRIWHSRVSAGITVRWQKLGENVGMGGSEPDLHAAFVASGSHLQNLIDPAFTHAGVGVVVSGGIIFVSEVFMQPPPRAQPRARRAEPGPTAQRVIRVEPIQPQRALPPSSRKAGVLFRPVS